MVDAHVHSELIHCRNASELEERTVKEHGRMQVRASCTAATSQVSGVSGPHGAFESFICKHRS